MNTAKQLAAGFHYRGAELAKNATTCRRLATGLAAHHVDLLGLTQRDRETLASASTLLREMAAVYAKAATLRKAAEAARAQWVKTARAAMKHNFDTLTTTADKVALIALSKVHLLDAAALRGDRGMWHAQYLLKDMFADCLNDLAYFLSPRADGIGQGVKDLDPAAEVVAEWQRFLNKREQLQDEYAQVIVLVDRVLAQEKVS